MTLKEMFVDTFSELRRMDKRQCLYQALSFAMIVCTALMLWKGLMIAANTTSPIVVVLSGSMEPAFERGDLLFLTKPQQIRTGDIVVFKVDGRDVPIVHRVIKTHQRENGTIKLLTKGDNNAVDDRNLYADGQHWLGREDVVGVARGIVPYLGLITIVMNDYPQIKYGVLGLLAIFMLLNRD